ncbi:hypothetical protein CBR_g10769 [Chara braunii]|uniref:Uncharacterized protein n=1 Tax=Chara braunii TaxID=69332 RepID=A0A388KP65_CHABU|nr:hypothetical protein CBR_g10769 [Chara braunii]|eukprot:GBG71827.1 hypothetical protein CBR_g10769 [Chara braunii]
MAPTRSHSQLGFSREDTRGDRPHLCNARSCPACLGLHQLVPTTTLNSAARTQAGMHCTCEQELFQARFAGACPHKRNIREGMGSQQQGHARESCGMRVRMKASAREVICKVVHSGSQRVSSSSPSPFLSSSSKKLVVLEDVFPLNSASVNLDCSQSNELCTIGVSMSIEVPANQHASAYSSDVSVSQLNIVHWIKEIVSAKTTPQNTATMVDKDGNPLNEKKLDFNLTGLFRRIWLIHHDVENHGVARKHQYWIEDRALENFILDLADWNVAAAMTLPNEKGPTLFRNYSQLSRFDEDDDQDFAKAAAEEEAAVEKEAVAEEEAAIAEEAAVEEEAATEKEANEEQFEATDMHNPTSKKVSTRTQVANDEDEDIAEVRLFRRRRSLEKQVGTHVESVADRRESQEERSAENEFEPDDHELQDKNVADAEDVQQSQREGSTQNELDADVNEDTNIADAQHPQGEASQVNNGDEVIVEDLRSQSGSPSAEKNDILRHRRTSKGSQATTSQHKQT